jgi:hypothetical protein
LDQNFLLLLKFLLDLMHRLFLLLRLTLWVLMHRLFPLLLCFLLDPFLRLQGYRSGRLLL